MGVKVATTCLQWSAHHRIIPHSQSSSQTLASSKRRRCRGEVSAIGGSLACRYVPRSLNRSAFLGTQSAILRLSKSCELWEFSKSTTTTTTTVQNPMRKACSASLDFFSDEEFSKQIQELALKFRISAEEEDETKTDGNKSEPDIILEFMDNHRDNYRYRNVELLQESNSGLDSIEPPWRELVNHSSIERKANGVDLPLSLRIIKRKLQLEEGFREAGESGYSSVKRAFSSMVFMIEELHSFILQMRELLFYEDLQEILRRVQKEMHASFVWLFQQVFSHTPTLMVYVMILLAKFTVYSMGTNAAIAAATAPPPVSNTVMSSILETQGHWHRKFGSSSIKTFTVSSSGGKTTSIDGGGGGGGKARPVASGTDGNERSDGSIQFRTIIPDGSSLLSSFDSSTRHAESVSRQEEVSRWNSIVEEAERMRDPAVDQETRQRFVSPVDVKIEPDDCADYFRTELIYQTGLAQEPNNPLLLANYAQFLYLVLQDFDRAEEYFRRAVGAEPADPEAYSKYATFMWLVRNDLWAAEETFLEAISADPTNSYYAANYANFLWNTGGDETCFPLESPETPQDFC